MVGKNIFQKANKLTIKVYMGFHNLKIFNTFIIILISVFLNSCMNYSVSRVQTVPPILISLATLSTGGHLLVYRGTNPEIFFAGYKLYVGNTANEARNPTILSSGLDCTNRSLLPNLPIEYSIEIYSSSGLTQVATGENANRVCKFSTILESGKYISLRTLLLSFQPGYQGLQYSSPSNALIVP
ncbi:MAG: hypothetical protein EBS19_13435 [Spirochaetia bacterium]|nr:hypothetical protein [Spirochaetia bacterium]